MRCKACDSMEDVRRWKGDYYCKECRIAIRAEIVRDFDDTMYKHTVQGEYETLHRAFDDE